VAISPDHATAGTETTFEISVAYRLVSADSGEINIGFNLDNPDFSSLLPDEAVVVDKGEGNLTFTVTVIPVDWGEGVDFFAYVNISENPHPSVWLPLGTHTRVITLSD
jgi:hypothetical protein